jgi:GNAT superfamily N-acetyltransferase
MKTNQHYLFNSQFEESGLSKGIEDNLAEYQVAIAEVLGGKVHVSEPLTWVATSKPFAQYNGVFRSSLTVDEVNEKISEVIQECKNRNVPMIWYTGPSVWAYDASDDVLRSLQQIHQELGFGEDKPWRYYLGILNGEPVATSQLFQGSTACAVHWVVTVPTARRRGIGAAMTTAALRDARDMGYNLAILTASPLGANIYKKIGFQECCTISKYTWKP